MNTKVIDFSNNSNFVSNPYLQSKRTFETITGANRTMRNTSNSPKQDIENPFSIFCKTG